MVDKYDNIDTLIKELENLNSILETDYKSVSLTELIEYLNKNYNEENQVLDIEQREEKYVNYIMKKLKSSYNYMKSNLNTSNINQRSLRSNNEKKLITTINYIKIVLHRLK